jgi:hypothetical protein
MASEEIAMPLKLYARMILELGTELSENLWRSE